jgi:hypothetical protein
MRAILKFGLASFLALTAVPRGDATEPIDPGIVTVQARYSSSVLVFKVGEINLSARLSGGEYSASTSIRAAGLAALFTDFDIQAEVRGGLADDGLAPSRYAHVERTGDKVRAVDVAFESGLATASVEPPFGSLGQPPASAADRVGVVDPMSAVFQLSRVLASQGGDVCSGRIPVFDGKARYDLRLVSRGAANVRTRAWRGETVRCEVWYEPISGYDPEDYPSADELRHPLTVWLAPLGEGRVHFPVRMHTRAGFGGVTIEAQDLEFSSGYRD